MAERRAGGLPRRGAGFADHFLPIYLRAVRGASPAETGLLLLPMTFGIGIGSLVTGQLMTGPA